MIRSLFTSSFVCALLLLSTVATAQFSCSLHSSSESACDAASSEDGSGCVFCSWSSFNICVSEGEAAAMKLVVKSLTCDDDSNSSDDDDDDAVAPTSDDSIPDDSVFGCLKKENDSDCGKASCVWCDTKGGFGVCITEEAAELAKDSYWFDCAANSTGQEENNEVSNGNNNNSDDIQDPLDTACLLAGLAGGNDESVCVAAADSDSNSCLFCTISGIDLCLNADQAQIASLVGGSCDSSIANDSAGAGGVGASLMMDLKDPYDTACLMAQVTSANDQSACVSASDSDGYGCEWCSLSNGLSFCLNSEQASVAEVVGSTCESSSNIQAGVRAPSIIEKKEGNVQDPTDTACLLAGLAGGNDESACVAAVDSDGNACEFCSISNGLDFCVNSEQAQIASLVGATCDSKNLLAGVGAAPIIEKEEANVQDPADTACLLAGLAGGNDESACVAAVDSDGNACEFCSIANGFDFCLNSEQAQIASLVGGSCDSNNVSAGAGGVGGVGASLMDLKDPYDTTCLVAQISGGNDESACVSASDSDGYGCEWCSLSNGLSFCLSSEQASVAEVVGATCEDSKNNIQAGVDAAPMIEKEEGDVEDPADTACLLAGLAGGNDESVCLAAVDSDGNACEFCSLANGFDFCLNSEQAQIASLVGSTCDSKKKAIESDNTVVAYKKRLRN